MQPLLRITLLTALASAALYAGAACGPSEPAPEPTYPALADVVFEGGATPTALNALLDATIKDDAQRGAEIDGPPTDTVLTSSSVTTFSWHLRGPLTQILAPRQGPPALLPEREARAWPSGPLRELLGKEREAAAASTPLSGAGYFLLFSTDKTPRLLRVFTTKTTYTPDTKAWSILSSAKTWTTLSVFAAQFDGDALAPGGGPWKGTSIQFCIEAPP